MYIAGVVNLNIVNQPEVVHVHWELGVVNRPNLLNDFRLEKRTVDARHRSRFGGKAFESFRHCYSVETGSLAPFSAAIMVCQGRVAHLIRTGCSRTPARTPKSPSSPSKSGFGSAAPSAVTSS